MSSFSVTTAGEDRSNGNTGMASVSLIDQNYSSYNPSNENTSIKGNSSSTDPSVQLYTENSTTKYTTNGWIILNTSYSGINFQDDKIRSANFSGVPSGTIFNITGSPNSGYIFDGWKGTVNSTERSMNVIISNNTVEVALFSKAESYSVIFTQSGLPSGNWYVNITGQTSSGPLLYSQGTYSASLSDGSYTYSVSTGNKEYFPSPSSGSFTVNGAAVQETITFSEVTYSVTFTQSGLPSGAIWNITLNSVTKSSSASIITFQEPNGTYSYIVGAYQGYLYTPSAGSVTVNGASVSVLITFTPVSAQTYTVTFTESGLYSGSWWFVNSTGSPSFASSGRLSSGQGTYSLNLPVGSYSYTISASGRASGYFMTIPNSGTITVNGTEVNQDITFIPSFHVLFNETGLPTGTTWWLNYSGKYFGDLSIYGGISIYENLYSFNSSISSYVPNCTYTFSTGNVSGYLGSPVTGKFTVNGALAVQQITFTSIVSKKYEVAFTQTGLPTGTLWSITLNSSTQSSTSSSIMFREPNGSYFFTIGSVTDYVASPLSGTIVVSGSNVTSLIKFNYSSPTLFTVTFTESGLPLGTSWSVTLGRTTSYSTSSINVLTVGNGTYSYSIGSVTGYNMFPSTGSITVEGVNVNQAVTFTSGGTRTYTVSFLENGLVLGTPWAVTIGGASQSSVVSTNSFQEANGSYSYSVGNVSGYMVLPYSGTVKVNGEDLNVNISFTKVTFKTYAITFTEAGLPTGTSWSVALNGSTQSSISSSIVFNDPNGTYSFTVGSVSGYAATPSSSSLMLSGYPVTESITFSPKTYPVTFTETGLPSGTTWSITLNGQTFTSLTSTITFSEPNGSYSYSIGSISGYTTSPSSGLVTVSGSNLDEAIVFTKNTPSLYAVTFTEYNLPPGTEWYVNLTNGQSFSTSSTSISFHEPNGTYTYTIATGDKEYCLPPTPFPPSGTFTVNGSSIGESFVFQLFTYPVYFYESGLPPGSEWYVNITGQPLSGPISAGWTDSLPNGTYTYSVSTGNKEYSPSPSSGLFTVNGAAVTVSITFTPVTVKTYSVTFTETGLYPESTWSVTSMGSPSFASSGSLASTTAYVVDLPDGSYLYKVNYNLTAGNPTAGYLYSYPPLVVNGGNLSITVKFTPVFAVIFTESGLPSGAQWYVNVTGQPPSGPLTGSVYELPIALPNGTFPYSVVTVSDNSSSPGSGNLTVSGSNVNEVITFPLTTKLTFSVIFIESGLPANIGWSVTLNGITSVPSTPPSVEFTEPNGTYSYSIGQISGYSSSSSSGSVIVSGSDIYVAIRFTSTTRSTYPVTFTETGLPSGTSWSVTLNGSTQSSTTSSIVFDEPNGTYSYFIETVPGWSSTPTSGTVNLNGNELIEVTFIIKTYEVMFEETGLQSGTTWYLNLTGYNSSGPIRTSTYSIALANGTYYYTVSQEENYFASNGSFTVNGKLIDIKIGYEKFALMEIDLQPSTANLLINGNGTMTENGIFQEYVKEGYYFINATEAGYTSYSNLIYLSWNETYWQNITLKQIGEYGYLAGTVIPGNATILANGIPVPVTNGFFNTSLTPGMYYISVTAKGYEGYVTTVNVSLDEATSLEIVLKTTQTSVTVSGYVVPLNSSVTVNGLVAYVNSTGFYRVYVPSGNVTVSAYANGYYSYSITLNLQSSREINITLAKEAQVTSVKGENGTIARGYNVTISSITMNKGIITVSYNTTTSGTLVVLLPEYEILNTTIASLLNSTVFIDGVQYHDFTITISSNGSVILTVYGLSGDPTLYWKYSPAGSVPSYYTVEITESGLPEGTGWYLNLTNGQVFHSSSSTITFQELNGTYSYSVKSISGYEANTNSGSLTVKDNPVNVTIAWTIITYSISVTQNGIPNGMQWAITLTGTTFTGQSINTTLSSTTSTITFNEPNGSYSYTVHLPSGYSSNNMKGSMSVTGTSVLAKVNAQQVTKPTIDYLLYAIIAIVIIVAIIGALVVTQRGKKKQGTN